MGFLTTLTIYNDELDLLKDHGKEFSDKLYDKISKNESGDLSLGNLGNFAKIQKTKDSNTHTVYVHAGNCLTEINTYSDKMPKLIREHPEFCKILLRELVLKTRELKNLIKLHDRNKKT